MNVVILSDTHRSPSYIKQSTDQICKIGPDLVIHLGDFYSDADVLIDAGLQVKRVPGTWTSFYKDASIPNRTLEDFCGWTVCLSHTPGVHFNDRPEDLDPTIVFDENLCDIFMHGHTHHPTITLKQHHRNPAPTGILNPGHLKEGDDRGYPPTYAVARVSDSTFDVTIYELLTQKPYMTGQFKKNTSGQVTLNH